MSLEPRRPKAVPPITAYDTNSGGPVALTARVSLRRSLKKTPDPLIAPAFGLAVFDGFELILTLSDGNYWSWVEISPPVVEAHPMTWSYDHIRSRTVPEKTMSRVARQSLPSLFSSFPNNLMNSFEPLLHPSFFGGQSPCYVQVVKGWGSR